MIRFNYRSAGEQIAELSQRLLRPEDVVISNHRDDGSLLGGVIFSDYCGPSCTIHQGALSPAWLGRDMRWVIFHYPFVQLGCTSLIGMTPSDNPRALRTALGMGFEVETAIKDCLPGGASLIITRMWRDKCRWLQHQPRTLRCNITSGLEGGLVH